MGTKNMVLLFLDGYIAFGLVKTIPPFFLKNRALKLFVAKHCFFYTRRLTEYYMDVLMKKGDLKNIIQRIRASHFSPTGFEENFIDYVKNFNPEFLANETAG